MIKVEFKSFGFKYGILEDAKIIIDARLLPNPYWDESLRSYCGLDKCVADFISDSDVTRKFLKNLYGLLDSYFEETNKKWDNTIIVGIGCTGGQHRSVFVAETLYEHYKGRYDCSIIHREKWRYKKE